MTGFGSFVPRWFFDVMGSPSPKMLDVVSYLAPISSFFVLAHQQKSARSVLNLVKKKTGQKTLVADVPGQ